MKRVTKLTLISAFVCIASAFSASAQQKFGYINFQQLLFLMPERDSIILKLQKLNDEFVANLEEIQVEYNNRFNDYQQNQSTYTNATRQIKEKELADINKRYNDYQELAQQEMAQMENQLYTPVVERAQNAIKKVGTDNGLTAIFDVTTLLFYNTQEFVDITPMVKTELGIKDEPANTQGSSAN